jgi:hypothetical protein
LPVIRYIEPGSDGNVVSREYRCPSHVPGFTSDSFCDLSTNIGGEGEDTAYSTSNLEGGRERGSQMVASEMMVTSPILRVHAHAVFVLHSKNSTQ